MPSLEWLTARPIAHRGLHDASRGVIENTASAFSAAIAGEYGIECDLQISADGEAMVYHDDALGRLTEGSGRLAELKATDIQAVHFKNCTDRILALGDLCALVGGRTTLLLELKSRFDGDVRLPRRCVQVLSGYTGPVAIMSFDPAQIEAVRHAAPQMTRGIVAERYYRHSEWDRLSRWQKRRMAWLLHTPQSRPHFLAYSVKDLPAMPAAMARTVAGWPVLAWTVRTEDDRKASARWADQMIFEGWRP